MGSAALSSFWAPRITKVPCQSDERVLPTEMIMVLSWQRVYSTTATRRSWANLLSWSRNSNRMRYPGPLSSSSTRLATTRSAAPDRNNDAPNCSVSVRFGAKNNDRASEEPAPSISPEWPPKTSVISVGSTVTLYLTLTPPTKKSKPRSGTCEMFPWLCGSGELAACKIAHALSGNPSAALVFLYVCSATTS